MLSHFPARDLDEPVTKEFVRAEIADVRAEFAAVRGEIAELRGDLHTGLAGVRTEIAELDARISDRFRQQSVWIVSATTVALGVATGISQLVG